MSLIKQCQKLSLKYEEIELNYSGSPEVAALEYYQIQGYIGSYNEGGLILNVLKALMLDELTKLNTFKERTDACSRYLEAQLKILNKYTDRIINCINNTNRARFISNFTEIINTPSVKKEYPKLNVKMATSLFDAISTKDFINIAYKISEDPYTFRKGWPDLTIIKNNEVRFIEIKTTDKLQKSQMLTIPVMRTILPYIFSVLKITNKRT